MTARSAVSFVALMALLTAMLVPMAAFAEVSTDSTNTCKDLGFDDNLTSDAGGDWGNIVWKRAPDGDGYLTVSVTAGYELTLCLKKGSATGGNLGGPRVLDPMTGVFGPTDIYWEYPNTGTTGISHYGYRVTELEPGTILVAPAKTWHFYPTDDDGPDGGDELAFDPGEYPGGYAYVDLEVLDGGTYQVEATWRFDTTGAAVGGDGYRTTAFELADDSDFRFVETSIEVADFSCEERTQVDRIAVSDNGNGTDVEVTAFVNDCWLDTDYEIEVDKVVTGNTAPAGADYEICLMPVVDDAPAPEAAPVCFLIGAGESDVFDGLEPGSYQVYEVDPGHTTLLSTTYSGDGEVAGELDGVIVALTPDDPAATVTVTNSYRNRTPTPQDVSASVTVTKVWVVDGVAVTPPAYTPSFDVTLDSETTTIDAGETATFGDLTDGDTYDLTVTEDVSDLPDAEVLFDEGCEFVSSQLSAPTTLEAPDAITVTTTNFYTCDVDVGGEVIEEPDDVDETPEPPEPPEPVEVKDETLVAELPKTGTSALLLTTLGLLGLGIGGRLLGRGRRG